MKYNRVREKTLQRQWVSYMFFFLRMLMMFPGTCFNTNGELLRSEKVRGKWYSIYCSTILATLAKLNDWLDCRAKLHLHIYGLMKLDPANVGDNRLLKQF